MTEHRRAEQFSFDLPRETAVYVCARVAAGAPVLDVAHEVDDDWQFLCGGEHGAVDVGEPDGPVVACLECVVADDPSLDALADLDCGETATRVGAGAPWLRRDEAMDRVRAGVAEHGWWVIQIPGGSEVEPGFAYTIGLWSSYRHPELIVVGMEPETAHAVLNELGRRIKAGVACEPGLDLDDILKGVPLRVREVIAPASYAEHVGWAIAYHRAPFPLWQVLWPERNGVFPGTPEAPGWMDFRQPLLP